MFFSHLSNKIYAITLLSDYLLLLMVFLKGFIGNPEEIGKELPDSEISKTEISETTAMTSELHSSKQKVDQQWLNKPKISQ